MDGEGGSVGSELPGVDILGVRYMSCWEELGEVPGEPPGASRGIPSKWAASALGSTPGSSASNSVQE